MVRREILRRPFPLGAFETRPGALVRPVSPLSSMRDVSPSAPPSPTWGRGRRVAPSPRYLVLARVAQFGHRHQGVQRLAVSRYWPGRWSERCPTWLPNRCGAKKWTAAEVALPLDTDWPSYGSPRRKWAFLRLTKQKSTEATAYLLMTFVACAPTCPA